MANVADEGAVITGLIRIYRESTGLLIYSSELAVTQIEHHTSTNIAALTPFDPPAPADDDYFIKADIVATSYLPGPPIRASLGSFYFDIKTPPMGEAPAGHHVTHENGGSDPIEVADMQTAELDDSLVLQPDGLGGVEFNSLGGGGGPHASTHENGGADEITVAGLSGLLADAQTPKTHKTTHQNGGSDEISVAGLSGELADDQPPKDHHTDHENGGTDEISVAGLSGALADAQTPTAHASSHEDGGADELEISDLATSEVVTGKVLQPDGAGGVVWNAGGGGVTDHGALTGLADDDHPQYALRHQVVKESDMLIGSSTSTSNQPWLTQNLSSGSQVSQPGLADHPGIVRFSCAASINSGARIYFDPSSIRLGGGEKAAFWLSIVNITDTLLYFGFHNSTVGATPTNAAAFFLDNTTGRLYGVCYNTAGNSATASYFTPSASTWYLARVVVNAGATQVDFYIYNSAGALVWSDSLTTNIPTAAGDELSHGLVAITKGTTAQGLIDLDWLHLAIPDRRPNP